MPPLSDVKNTSVRFASFCALIAVRISPTLASSSSIMPCTTGCTGPAVRPQFANGVFVPVTGNAVCFVGCRLPGKMDRGV